MDRVAVQALADGSEPTMIGCTLIWYDVPVRRAVDTAIQEGAKTKEIRRYLRRHFRLDWYPDYLTILCYKKFKNKMVLHSEVRDMEVRVNQLRNELRRREIDMQNVVLGDAPPTTGTDTPEPRQAADLPPEHHGEHRATDADDSEHSGEQYSKVHFQRKSCQFPLVSGEPIELLELYMETIRLTLPLFMLTATTVRPKHACLQSEPLYRMPDLRLARCHTFFFFLCVLTSRISRSERQSLSDDNLAVLAGAFALSLTYFLSDAAVL